jgi:hypothetical protein
MMMEVVVGVMLVLVMMLVCIFIFFHFLLSHPNTQSSFDVLLTL